MFNWWKTSIVEGLDNVGVKNPSYEFRMVYWADLLYKYPMHDDEQFHFDKLYNKEPYRPASPGSLKEYKDGWFDSIRAAALDSVGSTLDVARRKLNMPGVSNWLLGKLLKDLSFYYDDNRRIYDHHNEPGTAREVLDRTLREAILAEQDQEILLVAHSMGTIIGYNTLRDLGQSHPHCKVPEFISIGSPLGLPYVKGKIIEERAYDPSVRTPTCVTRRWSNYADRKDPIALDIHLRDDYSENASDVRVEDDLIINDYYTTKSDGTEKRNPHKSYGYLRTPEVAKHIGRFLRD